MKRLLTWTRLARNNTPPYMAHTKGTKHLRVLVLKLETRRQKFAHCMAHCNSCCGERCAVRGVRGARSLLFFFFLLSSLSPSPPFYGTTHYPELLFFFSIYHLHIHLVLWLWLLLLRSAFFVLLHLHHPITHHPSASHTSSDARPSPILRNHRDPKVFCHCLQLEPPRAVDAKVAPHPSKIPDQTLD
jgi:hypothetical protein